MASIQNKICTSDATKKHISRPTLNFKALLARCLLAWMWMTIPRSLPLSSDTEQCLYPGQPHFTITEWGSGWDVWSDCHYRCQGTALSALARRKSFDLRIQTALWSIFHVYQRGANKPLVQKLTSPLISKTGWAFCTKDTKCQAGELTNGTASLSNYFLKMIIIMKLLYSVLLFSSEQEQMKRSLPWLTKLNWNFDPESSPNDHFHFLFHDFLTGLKWNINYFWLWHFLWSGPLSKMSVLLSQVQITGVSFYISPSSTCNHIWSYVWMSAWSQHMYNCIL